MSALPSLADFRSRGQLVELSGHRLFVSDYGSGPPLLFLHGFPTSSFDYAPLIPLLASQRRLVLFDFLGFGYSDKPAQHNYSLFEQADFAVAVAKHLSLGPLTLVAHDMGSSVALELLRRPELSIEKLVLLNGSVLLRHYRPLISQRLLLHPQIGPLLTRLGVINRWVFGKQFGKLFPVRPSDEELDLFWELIRHNDGHRNYHLLIRYLAERKIHELTWLDALAASKVPLTLIWGQRDPVSVPAIAKDVLLRRPDATYVPLYDVGHYPQWEDPQTVAKLILGS
jgi:pimeloyl-ACP methyl ester carboxylesterase